MCGDGAREAEEVWKGLMGGANPMEVGHLGLKGGGGNERDRGRNLGAGGMQGAERGGGGQGQWNWGLKSSEGHGGRVQGSRWEWMA